MTLVVNSKKHKYSPQELESYAQQSYYLAFEGLTYNDISRKIKISDTLFRVYIRKHHPNLDKMLIRNGKIKRHIYKGE